MARNGLSTVRRNELWRPFFSDFDRLFEGAFGVPQVMSENAWTPAVDIHETDTELLVSADIPGAKREDLNVEFKDGILTVSGERRMERKVDEENETVHRTERFYGKFSRSFRVPGGYDLSKIEAKYNDGVLEIRIPKAEEAKPKAIEIK